VIPPDVDPRAVAMKAMTQKGWSYRNGQIGKSVMTMTCPAHKTEPLKLEADSAEEAAKPDLALDENGDVANTKDGFDLADEKLAILEAKLDALKAAVKHEDADVPTLADAEMAEETLGTDLPLTDPEP
jgi:hypothetical protein